MLINDLRQLEIFRTLAQTGSFRVAADSMNVTQSAISHSLKNLENSLGRKLIVRGRKECSLTPEGAHLLRHTHEILSRVNLAVKEIQAEEQWGSGELHLGAQHLLSGHLLPPALYELRGCFPDATIELATDHTEELLRKLQLGQIDLVLGIIFPREKSESNFQITPLFDDEICLLLPPEHPSLHGEAFDWANERSVIMLKSGSPEQDLVYNYVQRLSVRVPIRHQVTSEQSLKSLVTVGMGVGFAPKWLVQEEIDQGEIVAVSLPGKPIHRQWGVYSLPDKSPTVIEQTLIGLLKHSANLLSRWEKPRHSVSNEQIPLAVGL